MKIIIYSKSIYGKINWYVRDTVIAQSITKLTGNKTISLSDVEALRTLGIECVTYTDMQEVSACEAMRDCVSA